MAHVRRFESGATRNDVAEKIDPEGYLSPLVIERYCAYMQRHQQTPDGVRASDNWQFGIPPAEYMKSLWRHFLVVWRDYRQGSINQEALCAVLFNASGLLHEAVRKDVTHGSCCATGVHDPRVVDGAGSGLK